MLPSCGLALVLLMDVSGSISDTNYIMQRDAAADAMVSVDVISAIKGEGSIAITVIEWAHSSKTVIPWRVLSEPEDLAQLALDMKDIKRTGEGMTALVKAYEEGIKAFDTVPCEPIRMVIDISGDGIDNTGEISKTSEVRDEAFRLGIVVNGLPIITPIEPTLVDYYADQVVTIGGFVIIADGFEAFGKAMRKKLTYEISNILPSKQYAVTVPTMLLWSK